MEKKAYHTRTIDTHKTLTSEQVIVLLEAKEIITMDVYGDNQGIIADCVPEIADFMDDVLPEQKADDEFKEELLDIVADTSEYLVEAS